MPFTEIGRLILKRNSKLRRALGESGYKFFRHGIQAVDRILPHTKTSNWKLCEPKSAGSSWKDSNRRVITLTFIFQGGTDEFSLSGEVSRRSAEVDEPTQRTLDAREYDLCNRIATRLSSVVSLNSDGRNSTSLSALQTVFDEQIIADHLQAAHKLEMDVGEIFAALHMLAQQSYENKAISFGCVIDPHKHDSSAAAQTFPGLYLREKRFRALSDGFRTAYYLSAKGNLAGFVDLTRLASGPELTLKHIYPEWAKALAHATEAGRIGIALSRQGDILVFYEGILRFTYRFGQWQYWNHRHLLELLKTGIDAKGVQRRMLNNVITRVYRTAIEVSFRRSGGLIIVLTDSSKLRKMVRRGDAIGDKRRGPASVLFDEAMKEKGLTKIPQSIVNELAALDGAVVVDRTGSLLSYGAVLRSSSNSYDAEGSRTKAAIAASSHGLAMKISSDGDITAYLDRQEYFRV